VIFESYSIICVSCLLNAKEITWTSYGVSIQSSFTILFFLLIFGFPLLLGGFLWKNFSRLENYEIFSKYSAFYEDLKLTQGREVLIQPLYFLFRRFLLAVTIVLANQTVIWQVGLMTAQIITAGIIIGRIRPFKETVRHNFEFFNEVIIMLVMYHIICFTPFVPDLEVRFRLGYLVCLVVAVHLLVNLFFMAKDSIRNLRMSYKSWRARKEFVQQRADILEKWAKGAAKRKARFAKKKRRLEHEIRKGLKNKTFEDHLEAKKKAEEEKSHLSISLEEIEEEEEHVSSEEIKSVSSEEVKSVSSEEVKSDSSEEEESESLPRSCMKVKAIAGNTEIKDGRLIQSGRRSKYRQRERQESEDTQLKDINNPSAVWNSVNSNSGMKLMDHNSEVTQSNLIRQPIDDWNEIILPGSKKVSNLEEPAEGSLPFGRRKEIVNTKFQKLDKTQELDLLIKEVY